ncbi:MAG: protein translocase subunit SecF [Tumebacillaceae bacterium]
MKFEIVKNRKWYFIVSIVISIIGIAIMFTKGLNLGTDFKAGSRVQFTIGHDFDVNQVAKDMEANVKPAIKVAQVQKAQNNTAAIVRIDKKIEPDQENSIKQFIKQKYGKDDAEIDSVDPTIAREMAKKALYAILYASIGIIIYMGIRFEYRFAISGVISLLQVVLIVVSLFALLQIEIDLPFIAAILTIVGYCIHDTIVIFDRIRENIKHTKVKTVEDLEGLVNDSIWQTMARSINTVVTVVISAGAIYLLGGAPIQHFALALLIGLVTGAYSSIFIASQLWVSWRKSEMKKGKKAKTA